MDINYFKKNGAVSAYCIGRIAYNNMYWEGHRPPISTGSGFYKLGPESCGWKTLTCNPWFIKNGMCGKELLSAIQLQLDTHDKFFVPNFMLKVIKSPLDFSKFNPIQTGDSDFNESFEYMAFACLWAWGIREYSEKKIQRLFYEMEVGALYGLMLQRGLMLNTEDFFTKKTDSGLIICHREKHDNFPHPTFVMNIWQLYLNWYDKEKQDLLNNKLLQQLRELLQMQLPAN